MNILEILDEIEEAYPTDIFPDTSRAERDPIIKQYPGFIDRTSAMMGRHLVKVIREKLETKAETDSEIVDAFVVKYGSIDDWDGSRGGWFTALGAFISGWRAREGLGKEEKRII